MCIRDSIGRVQLKHLEHWTKQRQVNSKSIKHKTKLRENAEHAWHQLCVLAQNPTELIAKFNSAGIDARVHYPKPCNKHEVYVNHCQHSENLPVCEDVSSRLVAIPVHPSLSPKDINRINSVLNP